MELCGKKWVTALSRFPCFRNLSDYNLEWESVIKTTIYRERQNNTSIAKDFFSNAAWFVVSISSINKTEQNETSYI